MADVNFRDGMDFGVGVDFLRNSKIRGTAVKVTPAAPVPGGGGRTTQFSLLRTKTIDDYQSALTVGADASVGIGLFAGGSGSFDFSKAQKFHSFSEFIVVTIVVTDPLKLMHNVELTVPAQTLLATGAQEDKDRFAQEFGDMFVQGIKTGAAFFAVGELTAQTAAELTDISAKLDAAEFGTFSVGSQFKSALSNLKTQVTLGFTSSQIGGSDQTPKHTIDDIVAKADALPNESINTGVPIVAFLQDYLALDLPKPPNIIDFDSAQIKMSIYYRRRNEIVKALNDIDYIQGHLSEFVNPGDFHLQGLEADLQDRLSKLEIAASNCVNDIRACKADDVPTMPPISLPSRITGAGVLVVPDFVGKKFDDANTLAENARIIVEHIFPQLLFDLRVESQNIFPGAQITPTTHVVLTFKNASLPPP